MAKSAVKSVFSLHPLPAISPPNRPFSSNSATLGTKTTFCGAFPSSLHWIFSPEISFCTEKNNLTGCFCLEFARISTFAGEEKKKECVFSSNHRRSNIKMGKECIERRKPRTKSKRISWKNKKRRTKHIRASQKSPSTSKQEKLFFSPSPTPLEKYKPTFSQNFSTFRDFLPCFSQNLPTPHTPLSPYAQDTRLRVYTRSRTQRICLFCLHPSPRPTTNCISTG